MTNPDCHGFREALSRALEGMPVPPALTALSWHEHLLACGDCRQLLEDEEALEVLLATLPEPNLPPELKRRIVARLSMTSQEVELDSLLDLAQARAPEGMSARVIAGARGEAALDRLLDLDPEPEVPADLAARVRAGLTRRREEEALDLLLEVDGGVATPAGLSDRVLAGLAADRERVVPRLRILRHLPVFAAAAGLVLAALGWTVWGPGPGGGTSSEKVASRGEVSEPDPQLLEMLDVLENDHLWEEAAQGEDLPTLLADTLDPGDEILLAFLDE